MILISCLRYDTSTTVAEIIIGLPVDTLKSERGLASKYPFFCNKRSGGEGGGGWEGEYRPTINIKLDGHTHDKNCTTKLLHRTPAACMDLLIPIPWRLKTYKKRQIEYIYFC